MRNAVRNAVPSPFHFCSERRSERRRFDSRGRGRGRGKENKKRLLRVSRAVRVHIIRQAAAAVWSRHG